MTAISLPEPHLRRTSDGYGHARMPRSASAPEPEHIDRVAYGRFRNVYLYITEACQLRCEHCYMGERLDRALKMPLPQIIDTLATWRRLGGSKLTILGGEPTLHPDYCAAIRAASQLGYEHVITTTNAQAPALAQVPAARTGRLRLCTSQPGRWQPRLARCHPRHRHLRHSAGHHGRADQTRFRRPHHLHGEPGQPQ